MCNEHIDQAYRETLQSLESQVSKAHHHPPQLRPNPKALPFNNIIIQSIKQQQKNSSAASRYFTKAKEKKQLSNKKPSLSPVQDMMMKHGHAFRSDFKTPRPLEVQRILDKVRPVDRSP